MLIRIIAQYLASHKRIVVPQLGTFVAREPGGSVLFSELLKRDDGVLRGLLRDGGMGELEAAGEIDRFVFEVRHAVGRGETYPLDGFGVMSPGPNGTIAFTYDPPAGKGLQPDAVAGVAAGSDSGAAQRVADAPGVDAASDAVDGASSGKPTTLQPDKIAEAVRTAFAEPYVSPSVKMNPDPSVRGLRYGKPPKTTAAYTYVNHPPRRHADRFIWIAVIAAIIALGAIAFGWWRAARERQQEAEFVGLASLPRTVPAHDSAAAMLAQRVAGHGTGPAARMRSPFCGACAGTLSYPTGSDGISQPQACARKAETLMPSMACDVTLGCPTQTRTQDEARSDPHPSASAVRRFPSAARAATANTDRV